MVSNQMRGWRRIVFALVFFFQPSSSGVIPLLIFFHLTMTSLLFPFVLDIFFCSGMGAGWTSEGNGHALRLLMTQINKNLLFH